jgi:hypothetical protein
VCSAQAEEYHGGDDNTMHDGHGKFQFPRDPVQTKFKDAVIYVQYGDSSNQSVSGFRTAIDGIFQNSDGSTSLGWQKSPKIDDDEQVDWEKLLTDKPASDCQKVSYHKYGKSDSAKACKTKHPSIYQDSNGATTLSWILCNSTQVDICGLKNSTSSNSSTGSSNQSNNNNNGNTNVNNGNNNNNNSNGNSNSGSNNGSGSDNGSGSSSSSQIYYPPNFSQDDGMHPFASVFI